MIKKNLIFIIFLLLFFSVSFCSETITLNDIKIENNKIIIKKGKDTKFEFKPFGKPSKLFIDLSNLKFRYDKDKSNKEIRHIAVNSKYIEKIRTSQFTKDNVRIVIDTKNDFIFDVKENNDELVVDIKSKEMERIESKSEDSNGSGAAEKENQNLELLKSVKSETKEITTVDRESGNIESSKNSDKISEEKKDTQNIIFESKDINNILKNKIKLLEFKDVDIKDVLRLIAKDANLNIVISDEIFGKITIRLSNITIEKALETILSTIGYTYKIEENILRLEKNAATFKEKEFETKIYNIKFANIDEIYRLVKNTVHDNNVLIEKDSRTNALLVTAEKNKLDDIKKIIDEIDKLPEYKGTEVITFIFTLSYSTAAEMKNIIQQIISTQQFEEIQMPGKNILPRQEPKRNIELQELPIFKGKTNVVVDERTNSLIVTTNYPENINVIKEIITKLDKPVPQVLIEAKFFEVSFNKSEKLGIDWADFGNITAKTSDKVVSTPVNKWKPVYGTLDVQQMSIFLKALDTKTKVKILSTPRVTTLNNKTAVIKITESIITDRQVINDERHTSESTIRTEVGIVLEVTPHINVNNYITMELKPSVNEPKVSSYQPGEIDILKREANTNVVVKDGATIILGGLIKNKLDNSEGGLPLLSKVPGLNRIFGSKENEDIQTELLIFVTPYIISEDSQKLKEEEKKFNELSAPEK